MHGAGSKPSRGQRLLGCDPVRAPSTSVSFGDEDEAAGAVDELADVFNDCPSFVSTEEDGTKTSIELGALSFPEFGDDALAYALTGTSMGFDLALNPVIVRAGQTLALVSQGGLATDVAALESAVKTTMVKLPKAAGQLPVRRLSVSAH